MIWAILSVADLEKVSVKRIRNAVQELFAVDLQPHKVCFQLFYPFFFSAFILMD